LKAERIQTNTVASKIVSADMLELVFSIKKNAPEAGAKIKIDGFGNFEVNHKKNQIGRNHHTGETITIEVVMH
jgi:nucleoid DNA-binding protein